MSGKGSNPRPLSVPRVEYDDAWERTFGKPAIPKRERGHAKDCVGMYLPDPTLECDCFAGGQAA